MRAFTEPEMKVMAVNLKENIATSGSATILLQQGNNKHVTISYSGNESKIIGEGPIFDAYIY